MYLFQFDKSFYSIAIRTCPSSKSILIWMTKKSEVKWKLQFLKYLIFWIFFLKQLKDIITFSVKGFH